MTDESDNAAGQIEFNIEGRLNGALVGNGLMHEPHREAMPAAADLGVIRTAGR